MIPLERQRRILESIRRDGSVRTVDLAREFAVAEETIRRDLDLLARAGHLRRTHGGAVDAASPRIELSHDERGTRQLAEKRQIARTAAGWILPRETVLLDASSTALELCQYLPVDAGLRVVTYALEVVRRLAAREDIELVQLGGVYERRGQRFSGLLTEAALRALRIDRLFFSGSGFDLRQGIGDANPDQARLKCMMLSQAAWSCALIDHTKLGVATDHYFAPPSAFHALVTDVAGKSFTKKHLAKARFECAVAG
jgi:DeoR family L-fucose operon activator